MQKCKVWGLHYCPWYCPWWKQSNQDMTSALWRWWCWIRSTSELTAVQVKPRTGVQNFHFSWWVRTQLPFRLSLLKRWVIVDVSVGHFHTSPLLICVIVLMGHVQITHTFWLKQLIQYCWTWLMKIAFNPAISCNYIIATVLIMFWNTVPWQSQYKFYLLPYKLCA